ncbi:TlpA family protein disulfide reductase [Pseudobacter ginsenosidimutans]|uniref:AhpC/TSA family protein n=1 Tax=Pseudobacter ginsenosidimutans TaxID=661488 RepID=A0A4Q7N6G3_9BACT|nr:TlpA disulfide reductase family protein [Pseudobacter ginsenosidimutans]QEC45104.1 TlpA family protein disulfide reductase [Pseudobacter ginsenosidimutans]RZS76600.1 AhpC/TSA family protein [Pseudobacter ginsenosidimutans]
MHFKVMNAGRRALSFVLVFMISLATLAQEEQQQPTLFIGDKAPPLKYGKWIKGKPVKGYEKGRLYLFEFWATWCGPCIASMPHLSEFAKENKDRATVIAVNIWESKSAGKLPGASLPKVEKFVKNMGDKMGFSVISDSEDQWMGNKWMKAAGQSGIPCTFMVKDGIIQWMGHPIELDSIVKVVNSGNYDVMAARNARIQKDKENDSAYAPFRKLFGEYEKAVKEKRYHEALKLTEEGMKADPNFAGTFGFFKFQVLLDHINEDSAIAFAKEWQKSKPGYVASTGAVIVNKPGLKKEAYLYGIELSKTLFNTPQPASLVYNMIAKGYANMGDYAAAVENQEKSVAEGKQAMKDGKFAGFITADTIAEGEKELAEYRKKLGK